MSLAESQQYTLLALPFAQDGEQNHAAQLQRVKGRLGEELQGAVALFHVAAFKPCSLDALVDTSDELARLDPALEQVCFRLAALLEEAQKCPRAAATMLRLQATSQHGTGPSQYVKEFAWKRDVYPLEEAIPSLLQKLAGEGPQAEERCRSLLTSYSDKNTRLQNAQRRLQGNLSSRSIREAVGSWARRQRLPDDKPLETDFLTTLFVAVPRAEQEQFVSAYGDMDDHIIPGSLSVVAQDGEFVLNAIVCFKRPQVEGDKKPGSVEEIRQKLRKARYHVRDVTAADELSQQALEQLEREVLADKARLVALLQQQYSRCYVAWVHTKALRLYVEAVLKYGAQGKFVTALVSAEGEKTSNVLRRLREVYADFANPVMRAGAGGGSASAESVAVLDAEGPFVALKLANILRAR